MAAVVDPAPSRRRTVPGLCVKCKSAKPSVSIRRSLYCKECFVKASIHKFRTALRRSQRSGACPRTKAMVAFSGGAASSAMLRLAADFQHIEKCTAPPFVDVVVGHIDESCLFPGTQQDDIRAIAAEQGLSYTSLTLEDAFAQGEGGEETPALLELVRAQVPPGAGREQLCARLVEGGGAMSCGARVVELFEGLGSATEREEMLDILKTALIMRLARASGCGVVLLGDSGTRIATKVLTLTSRGRGLSLPLEAGSESRWHAGVVAYRPMRDFIAKEISFFNRWTGQRSVVVPTFSTGGPRRASIDRLAEAFVVELDRDFASTVPTVCRTLQRLELREEASTAAPCVVCGMPAEPSAHEWRDRLSIGAGHSTQPAPATSATSNDTHGLLGITPHMCYACQNLLQHASTGTVLPGFCTAHLKAHAALPATAAPPPPGAASREDLRKRIEEFFIESDDSDGCS
ncbi:Cytoplasmic tRNA 2-thiolation protein 2 [Coemansia sp. RSA 552]|nr:Cytoplasmic tRNA 2-thiolation protein 2 [Coemansia sp. RSA 552]